MINKLKLLIHNIKKSFFLMKRSWQLGKEFGQKYNRAPTLQEREEMLELCHYEWKRKHE